MAEPDDSQMPEDSSQPMPDDDIEALLAQAESLASNLADEAEVDPGERADPPDLPAGGAKGSDALGAVEQATGELDEIESLLKEAEAQAAGVLGLGDGSQVEEESTEAVQQGEQDTESSFEEAPAEEPSDEVSEDAETENGELEQDEDEAAGEESLAAEMPETETEEGDADAADVLESPSESDLEPDSAVLSDLVGDPDVDLSEPGEEEAQEAVQAAAEAVEKVAKADEKRAGASAKEKLEAKPDTEPDAKADAKTDAKAKDSAKKDKKTKKTEKGKTGDEAAKDDKEKGKAASVPLKTRLIEGVKGAIPAVVGHGRFAAVTTRRILQNAVLELFVILDKPFAKLSPNTKKYMGLAGLVTVVMGGLMWVLPKLLDSNPYLDMPPFPPVEPK